MLSNQLCHSWVADEAVVDPRLEEVSLPGVSTFTAAKKKRPEKLEAAVVAKNKESILEMVFGLLTSYCQTHIGEMKIYGIINPGGSGFTTIAIYEKPSDGEGGEGGEGVNVRGSTLET